MVRAACVGTLRRHPCVAEAMTAASDRITIRADWRRSSYVMPLLVCCMLVTARGVSLVLRWWGVHRIDAAAFSGPAGLALFGLAYLLLLEIPKRRLIVTEADITLESWLAKRTIAWAEIVGIQPGFGGWLSVNRQLPAAAILVLRSGATQAIPDVFALRRAALVRLLGQRRAGR